MNQRKTVPMNIQKIDEKFLKLAIDEAIKALGRTSPNPCVGAVIVKDGQVVATGYHKKAGTPHAEVHALRRAGDKAQGATLYVTLEPCNHTGRTPPCSHAVAKCGINRVVVGMLDPNPLVSGSGIQYLLDHKIEVTSGILEAECRRINEPYLKYITTGLPQVVLKAGISLDGRLSYKKGESGWITGPESLEMVHKARNRFDAILVGRNTVTIDNPSLTTRLSKGEGKDPVRVILDTNLSLSKTSKVLHLSSESYTWVFCGKTVSQHGIAELQSSGVKVTQVPCDQYGLLDLTSILEKLAEEGLISLLVEGGGKVHSSFLQQRLADKVYLFYAPIVAGSGGASFVSNLHVDGRDTAIRLTEVHCTRCGEDVLVEGVLHYPENKEGLSAKKSE